MTSTLSEPPTGAWIPVWPVSPRRLRVVGPDAEFDVVSAQACLDDAYSAMSTSSVQDALDREAPALCLKLKEWSDNGRVNAAPRAVLSQAALQGAALASAERVSHPCRSGFTHPTWHAVLASMEAELINEGGVAAVMALNAGYNGFHTGKAWAAQLEK